MIREWIYKLTKKYHDNWMKKMGYHYEYTTEDGEPVCTGMYDKNGKRVG